MRRNKDIDKVVDRGLQDYENSEYMEKLVSKQDRRGLSARKKWAIAIGSCSLALIVCLVLVFTLSPVFNPAPVPPAGDNDLGFCKDSGFNFAATIEQINANVHAIKLENSEYFGTISETHEVGTDKVLGYKICYRIDDDEMNIIISLDKRWQYKDIPKDKQFYNEEQVFLNGYTFHHMNKVEKIDEDFYLIDTIGYIECGDETIYLDYQGFSDTTDSQCLPLLLSLLI